MSSLRSIASLASCVCILVGARYSGAQDPPALDVLDRRQADVLIESIREEGMPVGLRESVRTRLRADGLAEGEVARSIAAIEKRMRKELSEHVRSLQGRPYGDLDAVERSIAARRRMIAHNVASWPKGYANGFPAPYVIDAKDADRLLLSVDAIVRACETSLRDTVRRLASDGTLPWEDVRILRDFSRARGLARARRTISKMRGAAFFSEADARLYLETVIAAELETLRQRVDDPRTRTALLERARTRAISSGS